MPFREEEMDAICGECGKVIAGPHKGETMKPGERQQKGRYGYFRGSPISDTTCEDCQKKPGGHEEKMAARYGPDWREKVEKAKRAQEEQQPKTHIWWRKPGE